MQIHVLVIWLFRNPVSALPFRAADLLFFAIVERHNGFDIVADRVKSRLLLTHRSGRLLAVLKQQDTKPCRGVWSTWLIFCALRRGRSSSHRHRLELSLLTRLF